MTSKYKIGDKFEIVSSWLLSQPVNPIGKSEQVKYLEIDHIRLDNLSSYQEYRCCCLNNNNQIVFSLWLSGDGLSNTNNYKLLNSNEKPTGQSTANLKYQVGDEFICPQNLNFYIIESINYTANVAFPYSLRIKSCGGNTIGFTSQPQTFLDIKTKLNKPQGQTKHIIYIDEKINKCECGSDKSGLLTHSTWCPRHVGDK